MKNLTILLLLFSLFQPLHAQEETRNNFILGGSISFQTQDNSYPISVSSLNVGSGGLFSSSTNDTKNNTLLFLPYFGMEIQPHLTLGIQLDYRIGNYKAHDIVIFGQSDPVDFERQFNQVGFGIFSRYTFNPETQINLFLQPYIEYNILHEKESQDGDQTQEEKANFIEAGLSAGGLYNISDRLRATLRLGLINYVNGNWKIVDTDTQKDFSSVSASLNLSGISIGLELQL